MSNEIDDIIRGGLGGFQPEFNPNDWEKMEEMLDTKKRIVPLWLWEVAASVAILLSAGTLYYFVQQPKANNASMQMVAHNEWSKPGVTGTTTYASLPDGNAAKPYENANNRSTVQKNVAVTTARNNSAKPAMIAENMTSNGTESDKPSSELSTEDNMASSLPKAQLNNELAFSLSPSIDKPGSKSVIDGVITGRFGILNGKILKPQKPFKPEWWIGPAVKPALTIDKKSMPVMGMGLMVGMDLEHNLGVQAGVYYDQMKYSESPTSEYNIGARHVHTDGDLDGIYVPVSATYTLETHSKIKPIIRAGLAAFFPLKEKYIFAFRKEHQNGNPNTVAYNGDYVRDTLTFSGNHGAALNASKSGFNSTSNAYYGDQSNQKSMYLLASVGAGIKCNINSKLSLQATAGYAQPLHKIGIEKRSLKQVDLSVGMQYYLN